MGHAITAGMILAGRFRNHAGEEIMQDTLFTRTKAAFSMTCRVDINIRASTERVWQILSDARNFPRWNSTVSSIEGEIRNGERLRMRVPGSDRVFTPLVSDVVPAAHMTWTGGVTGLFKGVRTFDVIPAMDGSTDFAMEEQFSGLMLPLVGRMLPDFGPIFERYARDLKRESERMTVSALYGGHRSRA
jgi:hypothetical protein